MSNDLHLDFETYSAADIRKTGGYRYARHSTTEVLICCYWLPGMDPVLDMPRIWLPRQQAMPKDLLRAAKDPSVVFWAHNAQFEHAVWTYTLARTHGAPAIALDRWRCTAALAASAGLARSLGPALEMLGGKVRKDTEGTRLIKIFCKPRKPTKANPTTRILPEDNPVEFRKFVRYCQRDVLGELELHDRLPPMSKREQEFYTLDLTMNVRGLPIDLPLVRKAHAVLTELERRLGLRVAALTGGIKATQRQKMLDFFSEHGLDLENLQKQTVVDVLAQATDLSEDIRELLALRIESSKSSTKKFLSMLTCTDPADWVVQGSFLFYGAHTGRYAGRLIQPQNFIRGTLKPTQQAVIFALLEQEDPDLFEILYQWPIDQISQCMRGFIRAPEGYHFIVVDYAAIEARVLAWVANEVGVLQAYREGVDVYKRMAASLFVVAIEEVTSEQRRLAKNLVLGCGYALGGKRFVEYCANLGVMIDPAFAIKAVKIYRRDHPEIVKSWKLVEDAVVRAIKNPGSVHEVAKCRVYMQDEWLYLELPSGRPIKYLRPKATPIMRYNRPAHQISFQSEYHGKPVRETTYGGKLVENIVQGIARDVMREGMFNAEENHYPVAGTVHDELITLRKLGEGSVHELEQLVCKPSKWMRGLPLSAEGFDTIRYRKG